MAVYCGYHRVHNQVNKQLSQINKTKLSWHHNFECQTWFYFDELWKGWWAKIVRKDDFIAHWFSKNSEEWQTKTIFLFVCNIQKHRSCVSEKEDKNIFPYIVSSVLLYCTNIQFKTTSKYLFGKFDNQWGRKEWIKFWEVSWHCHWWWSTMVQLIEWLSGKLELFRLRTGRLWLQHSFDICNGNRKSTFFLSQSECDVRLYVTLCHCW